MNRVFRLRRNQVGCAKNSPAWRQLTPSLLKAPTGSSKIAFLRIKAAELARLALKTMEAEKEAAEAASRAATSAAATAVGTISAGASDEAVTVGGGEAAAGGDEAADQAAAATPVVVLLKDFEQPAVPLTCPNQIYLQVLGKRAVTADCREFLSTHDDTAVCDCCGRRFSAKTNVFFRCGSCDYDCCSECAAVTGGPNPKPQRARLELI